MIFPPLKALLDTIRKHEAPKGYGQIYGGARGVPKDTDVSKLTLNGVLDFQQRMLLWLENKINPANFPLETLQQKSFEAWKE